MKPSWSRGAPVVLRGIYAGRVWTAQSVLVLQDTPDQVVLLQLPGAACAMPEGYWRWKKGDLSRGTRWDDMLGLDWKLREYPWHTNRFVMILEPGSYFATFYIWHHAVNEFQCYYINFQLPFQRTRFGFDTLDLDLDIVVAPDYSWRWKDVDSYQEGVSRGGIEPHWAQAIENAKAVIFDRIAQRSQSLDGAWLNWMPDPGWAPPQLPEGWQEP